jgi:hypothetical protein
VTGRLVACGQPGFAQSPDGTLLLSARERLRVDLVQRRPEVAQEGVEKAVLGRGSPAHEAGPFAESVLAIVSPRARNVVKAMLRANT